LGIGQKASTPTKMPLGAALLLRRCCNTIPNPSQKEEEEEKIKSLAAMRGFFYVCTNELALYLSD
jgi:hypothetical protein